LVSLATWKEMVSFGFSIPGIDFPATTASAISSAHLSFFFSSAMIIVSARLDPAEAHTIERL
jgi:hypothetical protein